MLLLLFVNESLITIELLFMLYSRTFSLGFFKTPVLIFGHLFFVIKKLDNCLDYCSVDVFSTCQTQNESWVSEFPDELEFFQ